MAFLKRVVPFLFGLAMSINFVLFWAIPIAGMGMLWKYALKSILMPLYTVLDESSLMRSFAIEYIYTKPEHADFFATVFLLLVNSSISLGFVFYWQLSTGSLPAWLVFAYYCSWVGIGGRIMGGAYTMAHKEVRRASICLLI
jgi:hypothetical protein